MIRIQLKSTVDPFERLLMNLVADWDELERWAIKCGAPATVSMCQDAKAKLLDQITEIRRDERDGGRRT